MLRREGFTLIELIIVVVIIGILAAIAIPTFSLMALRAQQAEAPAVLKQICSLAEAELLKTGSWPQVTVSELPGWAAPDSDTFGFSYQDGAALAEPLEEANPKLRPATMNCTTKVLELGG